MTIAISIKVHDGLVLASDSASTVMASHEVVNVYNNANKIFNLVKGLPIGGMTWGAGSIGIASISTLAKDLRKRLTDRDDSWHVHHQSYTVEEVANRTREFLFDEKFAHQDAGGDMGFLVAGYSSGAELAEEWLIEIRDGNCEPPKRMREQDECGQPLLFGQPDAAHRLMFGIGIDAIEKLQEVGLSPEQALELFHFLRGRLYAELVIDPMPIQDAIDLAEYLVHLTIMYLRFLPEAQTVGGPIEVAAITKHEGFKWVKRKHYYRAEFNVD